MLADLYLGDCMDVMRGIPCASVDAVITDPPYGIATHTAYKSRKRGSLAECNDFVPIIGDDCRFDPAPLLSFPTVILFGANHYAQRLPEGGAWLVWDKLDGLTSAREWGFNDNSDCELLWTNIGRAARIIRHRWMGAMKGSERNQRRVHPIQKPVALMKRLLAHYTSPGDTVLDPYMGSGSTGVACMQIGRHFIGIEIDPDYFALAKERIDAAEMQAVMVL